MDITINLTLLDRNIVPQAELGSYTIMVNTPQTEAILRKHYGRRGLGLKVFKGMTGYRTITKESANHIWGSVTIKTASIIQNLFAREGIAPRVYGLVYVNGIIAQVTDYIVRTKDPKIPEHNARVAKLEQLMAKYKIKSTAKAFDAGMLNWRDGKYVDFSHLNFVDFEAYKKELDIRARTRRGVLLSKAYQPVPELNIEGTRDIAARIANLDLNTLPFKDTAVLDIGCNFGAFSRFASNAGATRVMGIDKAGQLSFEINNVLGYWNMDIVTEDILKYIARKRESNPRGFKFDIVFLMAVQNYIGGIEAALQAVAPVVKKLIIVESHGGETREKYEAVFDTIDHLDVRYKGHVDDPQIRHQWWLFV